MTRDEYRSYLYGYLAGMAAVAGVAAVLAGTSESASRTLAVIGATSAGVAGYTLAMYPATKRIVQETIADQAASAIERTVSGIGDRLPVPR